MSDLSEGELEDGEVLSSEEEDEGNAKPKVCITPFLFSMSLSVGSHFFLGCM